MVNPATSPTPAVGGCLRCNQLFLVADSSSRCQFCGRPPDRLLPFGPVEAVGVEPEVGPPAPVEPEPEPLIIGVDCPVCHVAFEVSITPNEIVSLPPPTAPPVDEAAGPGPATDLAAPLPAETPPTPAMGRDFYGNPIPGQLVAPEAEEPEEPAS